MKKKYEFFNLCGLITESFLVHNHPIDEYAKDSGPGEVCLLCSFCHEPLHTLTKTNVHKFAIPNHTAFMSFISYQIKS